jgi:2-keto-4-pentenoate hydratase/2-oxohepta-3-ene-1,7-dioic acid hydratase in catechol pathway
MRRLLRTTSGVFLREGAKVLALGNIKDSELLEAVSAAQDFAEGAVDGDPVAPVTPAKLMLVGVNYQSHADEFGMAAPNEPLIGDSSGTAVVAPGSTVSPPAHHPNFMDYEAEMGIVIGRACENVSEAEASEYVLGVTPVIDLSLRDLLFKAIIAMRAQKEGPALAEAKTFPGSKPLGPEILLTSGVNLDSLDMPLTMRVNGELKQSGNVAEMIFKIPRLVSEASKKGPLAPGDVISSGTPAGVGMVDGNFLRPGDTLEVRLGSLAPLTITIGEIAN